jgi:DNA-binding protein H-NS
MMATLEQIQIRLKKLQMQADALLAKKAQSAVDQIRELMLKHGLTTADIEDKAKTRRGPQALSANKSSVGAKLSKASGVARYTDPATGATWTGQGRAPAWIASAADRSKFLTDGASETAIAAQPKFAGTKSAGAKAAGGVGQPTGAQPAKYINRKTGATWSGRGRAPAWLASVRDRSRFLIDAESESVATESNESVAAKPGKRNSEFAKKGTVKKAAIAKKVASKTVSLKKEASVAKTAVSKPAAKAKPATKKAVSRKGVARKSQPTVDVAGPAESLVEQSTT